MHVSTPHGGSDRCPPSTSRLEASIIARRRVRGGHTANGPVTHTSHINITTDALHIFFLPFHNLKFRTGLPRTTSSTAQRLLFRIYFNSPNTITCAGDFSVLFVPTIETHPYCGISTPFTIMINASLLSSSFFCHSSSRLQFTVPYPRPPTTHHACFSSSPRFARIRLLVFLFVQHDTRSAAKRGRRAHEGDVLVSSWPW